jgi:hypothetical protein
MAIGPVSSIEYVMSYRGSRWVKRKLHENITRALVRLTDTYMQI